MFLIATWPLRRLLSAGCALVIVALLAVAAAGLIGQQHSLAALQTI